MSAIAEHAFQPCTHPGMHGYGPQVICERCRCLEWDKAHRVTAQAEPEASSIFPRRYAIWLSAAEIEALLIAADREADFLNRLMSPRSSGWTPTEAQKDLYSEQLAQVRLAQAALELGQP